MTAVSNQFYVTLLSNSSSKIYKDNTLSAFMMKLAQPIDLNYAKNWEVGVCEVSCPPSIVGTGLTLTTIGNTHVLLYCSVISLQFVSNVMVRCLRTFIFPSTHCDNIFDKIYFVPVEQRKFQQIRIEFLKTDCKRVPFKDSKIPTKVILYLRKNYHRLFVIKKRRQDYYATFLLMHPLELYYRRQVGGGSETGIGPIYSTPPYLQRGHGIGYFFAISFAGFDP